MPTPKAGLRTMPTGALKNEQIFNEGVTLLEQLAYRGVISRGVVDPSGISPAAANGDTYLLPDGSPNATGDWSGQGGNLAVYFNGWRFIPPAEGLTIWITDEAQSVQYRSGAWVDVDEFPPTLLNDLDDVDLSGSPSPQDGETLVYDAATGKWRHGAGASGGGFRAIQTSGQAIGSTEVTVTWDDASTAPDANDSASIMDLANNRAEVPAGLNGRYGVFSAGLAVASGSSGGFIEIERSVDSGSIWQRLGSGGAGSTLFGRMQVSTGRVLLQTGDLWRVRAGYASTLTTTGDRRCFFSLIVQ